MADRKVEDPQGRGPQRHNLARDSLPAFFRERVEEAKQARSIELHPWTTAYLAQLLVRAGKTPQLYREDTPATLAEMHLGAVAAPRHEALRLYRHLGDHALTVAGYFSQSLRSKAVGVRYYTEMGEAAYFQVADLGHPGLPAPNHRDPWQATFLELASRFRECLSLLADIAERDQTEGTHDVLRVYERWLETRSVHAARRLAELGVLALEPNEAES